MRLLGKCICILGSTTALAAEVRAEPPVVFLNEFEVRGRERVEVFNSLPAPKSIAGWRLETNLGVFVFPSPTVVPGQGYLVVTLDGLLNDLGGEIAFIDIQSDLQDRVSWGQQGSAPLPPLEFLFAGGSEISVARAPDARTATPLPSTPETDGLYWNVDPTPTFGSMNDAPDVKVGTSILINEISLNQSSDVIELYNPLPTGVSFDGWRVSNGFVTQMLFGSVPSGGFRVIPLSSSFDIDDTKLVYLFDRDWVRFDQIGLLNAPMAGHRGGGGEECYARIPNGAGPNLGFDWRSSGGDVTLFLLPCTLGGSNNPVSGVPELPSGSESWGSLKLRWKGNAKGSKSSDTRP